MIESRTKSKLENQQIIQLCKKAFGNETQVGDIVELTDGTYNVSYLIKLTNSNKEVVLKVAPPPNVKVLTYEQKIMETEIMVYELIKNNTDVPIPDILYYDFDNDIIPSNYFFMSKVSGQVLHKMEQMQISEEDKKRFMEQLSEEDKKSLMEKFSENGNGSPIMEQALSEDDKKYIHEQLGKYTAKLHTIKGDFFGYPTFEGSSYTKTWRDAFLKMVQNIIDDGIAVGAEFPMPPSQIMELIKSKASALDEIKTPSLVHFDLWAGNIFIAENNGKFEIEGLIDCERTFWGDPHADFVSNIALMQDIRNFKDFINGYNQVSNEELIFTDSLLCRLSMYRIYLYLIMFIEQKYRKENITSEEQSFMKMMLERELALFKEE